jgi:hypothetical protein
MMADGSRVKPLQLLTTMSGPNSASASTTSQITPMSSWAQRAATVCAGATRATGTRNGEQDTK